MKSIWSLSAFPVACSFKFILRCDRSGLMVNLENGCVGLQIYVEDVESGASHRMLEGNPSNCRVLSGLDVTSCAVNFCLSLMPLYMLM